MPTTKFDEHAFRAAIARDGYAILPGLIDAAFIARARAALEDAIRQEAAYHGNASYADYGMVLLCSLYDRVFNEVFDNEALMAPFEAILGAGCIVYAYTSSSMPPGTGNYATRIHCDSRRIIPGYVTNLGLTLLLDDFTENNGATWFLPGSQTRAEAPSREEFFANALRLIAPAGSGLFFDAHLWHSGGENHSNDWRHALTVNMCRSWMKQRLDIPRVLHGRALQLSQRAEQKLGLHAQVPASYDEYYAPREKRVFRQEPD
jgi:ectoine hydroxylase-related dioxygenase (phytanoyl-CoA dioxygenase family)